MLAAVALLATSPQVTAETISRLPDAIVVRFEPGSGRMARGEAVGAIAFAREIRRHRPPGNAVLWCPMLLPGERAGLAQTRVVRIEALLRREGFTHFRRGDATTCARAARNDVAGIYLIEN
jgi:hypothetical protein